MRSVLDMVRDRLNARSFPLSISRLADYLKAAIRFETKHDAPGDAQSSADNNKQIVWQLLKFDTETAPIHQIQLDLQAFDALARLPIVNRRYFACLLSNILNSHISTNTTCLYDPSFWTSIICTLKRVGRPYLIIGDSHSRLVRAVGTKLFYPIIPIHVLCSAGSAIGLSNTNSRSGYGLHIRRISEALRNASGGTHLPIFIQFGQVDIEFVSTFRRIDRSELSFDKDLHNLFAENVALSYSKFVSSTFLDFDHVYCLSIFPPALVDTAWADGYINAHVAHLESDAMVDKLVHQLRELEIPSLRERTVLHREFNSRLKIHIENCTLRFVEVYDEFIEQGGTIDNKFIELTRGFDHHMDEQVARPIIRAIIEKAVESSIRQKVAA